MHFISNKNIDISAYRSNSQIVRILSEAWVHNTIFCPSCGASLRETANNTEACDFLCSACKEEFELKSKSQKITNKIVNGAYSTLMDRVESMNNPNLYVLQYNKENFSVQNFLVVPKYFFIKSIIEERKPLTLTARRAGWIGCNILIGKVPNFGKIYYIKDGEEQAKKDILSAWKQTSFVRSDFSEKQKGWLFDTMNCIDLIGRKEFSLNDIYKYEEALKLQHPKNKHIKDKLRQQLQILRDRGIIEFLSRGQYRMVTF